MTTENDSPLERLLDWCAGHVAAIRYRYSYQPPSTGEIDDDEVRQEIEQVEADMRAVERDHRSLVDAYGAAVQELQRLGAKSVPLAYHQPPRHGLEEFERNLRRFMATAMQIPEHMLGPLPAPQVYEVLAASVRSKGSGGGEPEPDAVLGMRAIRGQFQSERSVPPRREALEASLADVSILVQAWRESNSEVPAAIIEAAEARLRRALEQQNSAENKHSYAVPEAVRKVMEELGRAREKFPQWPDDPIHAATVVSEEAGELAQAALQSVYEPDKECSMHDEAVQTAAMAIRFLENMQQYEMPNTDQHDDRTLAQHSEPGRGETCPVCEKGTLTRVECCICDNCDASPVLTDQIRRNDKRLAARSGRIPEGWKLVPVEPTKEMCRANLVAADESILANKMRDNEEAYKAMIASAPEPDEGNDNGQ